MIGIEFFTAQLCHALEPDGFATATLIELVKSWQQGGAALDAEKHQRQREGRRDSRLPVPRPTVIYFVSVPKNTVKLNDSTDQGDASLRRCDARSDRDFVYRFGLEGRT